MGSMAMYLVIAVLSFGVGKNYGLESHMICKSVDDVFSSVIDSRPTSGIAQGPPGKKGVRGFKGETGDRGEKGSRGYPAVVDYQRIENVIERKFTAMTFCQPNGGYNSGKACYTVVFTASTNEAKALELCAINGGKPADLHNVEEYNAIMKLVRSKMTSSYVQLWLGMTYQPSSNALLLSNGTAVGTDFNWHPGYPKSIRSRTKMLVVVQSDASQRNQGLFNYSPKSCNGVICMKSFSLSSI